MGTTHTAASAHSQFNSYCTERPRIPNSVRETPGPSLWGSYSAWEAGNCSFLVALIAKSAVARIAKSADGDSQASRVGGSPRSFRSQAGFGGGGAVDDARKDTWETGRCARSWPALAVEMEEGGRDKAPLQPQQPPATSPGSGDEKPSGKERRDAGDKDKEQELVRRGPGSWRRRRPWAESRRSRRPRTQLPTAPPAPGEGR